MSTFGGKIQEIPEISVDRFDKHNLESQAFFLSHCHSDHMVGLQSDNFQRVLVKTNSYLYTSRISCIIISKMYPNITSNIKELSMHQPTFVKLKGGNLSVTPISAGHCPGSVMFLFETVNKCILYTGDFRVDVKDMKQCKPLYDAYNNLKTIDKIYIDTTFFLKSYLKFPKRGESLERLCTIIRDRIDMGKCFMINLQTSAKFGYEFLFIEIYKLFGMPIHVSKDMYDVYSLIPNMDGAVTLDSSSSQIHCHCGLRFKTVCDVCFSNKSRKIVVSALRWKHKSLECGISDDSGDDIHFVCYSTHNSYEETLGVIEFLRPQEIEICVEQQNPTDNKEVLDFVRKHYVQSYSTNSIERSTKLFKANNRNNFEPKISVSIDSFVNLDSPPLTMEVPSINKISPIIMKEKSDSVSKINISSDCAACEPINIKVRDVCHNSYTGTSVDIQEAYSVFESNTVNNTLVSDLRNAYQLRDIPESHLRIKPDSLDQSNRKRQFVDVTAPENNPIDDENVKENDSESFERQFLLDIINSDSDEYATSLNIPEHCDGSNDDEIFKNIMNKER